MKNIRVLSDLETERTSMWRRMVGRRCHDVSSVLVTRRIRRGGHGRIQRACDADDVRMLLSR
jgi:hypothetical protein